MRGIGNDRIIGIFEITDAENQNNVDFLCLKAAVKILYNCEGYTMPREHFQYLYEQSIRGNKLIDEDDARLECFPTCVVVIFCFLC